MKLGMRILFVVLLSLSFSFTFSQRFQFESLVEVNTTPVKSQDNTGTCWAYSTTSFIESEIMRMGGPELNLSEMYTVKYAYLNKAKQYVFLHGKGNFSQGGQAHDVLNVIADYGFVPEEYYIGKKDSSKKHNHAELVSTMKVLLDNYIGMDNAKPSDTWYSNLNSILTNYLGEVPEKVRFNKREYSPQKFAQGLGIDKSNYIELSSYSHHPFYEQFDLEVPDNWSHDRYYNLPIDELINVMKTALEQGYSFVWDGDVSEASFSHRKGVAFMPSNDSIAYSSDNELKVTQEDRQKAFLSWQVTDDHLMHIVGMVKDEDGTVFFKTKNSWGTESNKYGGYLYMSEAYVRMCTVAIMLHKNALDKDIYKKILQ